MSVKPTGIPAVGRNAGNSNQAAGVEAKASVIVADADLLTEVLRRAALIDPDALRKALADAEARYAAIRGGGYVEVFGGKMPRVVTRDSFEGNSYCRHSGIDTDYPLMKAKDE